MTFPISPVGHATAQELDKRVTLKKPTLSQDSYGQEVKTMTSQGSFWAKVTPLRSGRREEIIAGQKRAVGQTTILLRLNRVTVLVDETWSVFYNGQNYSILGKVQLNNRWIELTCFTGYSGV